MSACSKDTAEREGPPDTDEEAGYHGCYPRAQCLQPQMGVGEWVCASDSYISQIPKSVSSRAGKGLATLLISKGKAPRGLRGLQLSAGSRGLTATPVL